MYPGTLLRENLHENKKASKMTYELTCSIQAYKRHAYRPRQTLNQLTILLEYSYPALNALNPTLAVTSCTVVSVGLYRSGIHIIFNIPKHVLVSFLQRKYFFSFSADTCDVSCLNGGTCTRHNTSFFQCECQVGFSGSRCESEWLIFIFFFKTFLILSSWWTLIIRISCRWKCQIA
jgi:hypothetical protein